ncbi:MAG: DUF2922 domain-containing protein [Thermoanaerobacteraceae bacterium]|nr:DUF2922 domain-containing protein [Thermoanaerobacteraceae bacterium]
MTRRLELVFQNAAGRRTVLTVQEPRSDITADEVRAAMELIVARNVFTSPGGDLVAVAGARLVSRETVDLISV